MAVKKISLRSKGSTNFSLGDIYYPVTDYNYLVNKPSTFPPTAHNHDASNINAGVLSADRIPTLPQSKVTNLTTDLANKIIYNDALMPRNSFGGKKIFISHHDNAFFLLNERYPVTAGFYNKSDNAYIGPASIGTLFNSDYDGSVGIALGKYLKIHISFAGSGSTYNGVECWPAYPYGNLYLSYYYTGFPSNAKFRVYCNYEPHGLGWSAWTNFYDFVSSGTSQKIQKATQGKYAISEMEIIIESPDTGETTKITQIDFELSRPTTQDMPVVNKFINQKIYKDFDWVSSGKPKINGQVLVATNDSRLSDSRPASDVYSWAKQANKPSYNQDEVTDGSTYKRVTQTEKNIWDMKADVTDIENAIGDYDVYIMPFINGKLSASLKGSANGVAELGADGKVPSAQLPSFVDDVLEYANLASFPATGESGKIYVDLATNKTYRWGGSAYVVISDMIALGETSSTAYRGDRGKIAYDHSQVAHAPSNAQKNSDITKGEIEAKLTGVISTHSHAQEQVTNLVTDLANRYTKAGEFKIQTLNFTDINDGILILCPKGMGAGNNVSGSIIIQRSSGAYAITRIDFGYSVGASTDSYSAYLEFINGTYNSVDEWELVTLTYAGVNWIGLRKITTATYWFSTAYFIGEQRYTGANSFTWIDTVNATNVASITYGGSKKVSKIPFYATQLYDNNKRVVVTDDARLSDARPASDVYSWAKQANKPSYNANEIGGLGANYRWLTDAYISAWNAKEPAITKGNVTQYFRGDMSLAVFPSSMPASDVYSWAKQSQKPSYNQDEIAEGSTYKRVTESEKNYWNGKVGETDVENMLGDYSTNVLNPALADKVPTSRLIAGINLVDNITVAELTAVLGVATTSLQGVMSATDKARLDTLYALLNDSTDGSADNIVDTIQDILAIFSTYPEGADIVTALAGKIDISEATETATASKIAKRNSSGDIFARLFRSEYSSLSTTPNYIMVQHAVGVGADNYIRPLALSQLKTSLGSMPASDVYAWAKASVKPSYVWSEIGSKPSVIIEGDSRLSDARPASDVYAWAKASVKPTYNAGEVGALGATAQAVDSAKLGGLLLHSARNNEANKVVRTDANGYANFGWINTLSGNTTNAVTDVYVNTNDGYIRKKTLALFKTELGSMPASDVYAWAKASSKPTYNASEVGAMSTSHPANLITSTHLYMANGDGFIWNDTTNKMYVRKDGSDSELLDVDNISTLANGLGLAKLTDLDSYVPQSMTINGHPLNANISLYNQDIVPNAPTSKTSSFTLALVDKEDLIYVNSSSATTVTIPTNASVAFPVGTEVHILQYGSGGVNITPASGVTLYSDSNKRTINARYQVVTLKKLSTNTWVLFGALKS